MTEKESPTVENEPSCEHEDPVLTTSDRTESNAETKEPARRGKIKRPKSSEAEAWRALDADLIKTLEESLHGGAESKLNLIGTSYTKPARTGSPILPPNRGPS